MGNAIKLAILGMAREYASWYSVDSTRSDEAYQLLESGIQSLMDECEHYRSALERACGALERLDKQARSARKTLEKWQ